MIDSISFDLTIQPFHLLISSGSTVSPLSIGYHDINRDASLIPIVFTEDNPSNLLPVTGPTIYDECSKTKTCFGLPSGCLDFKNCALFGAVIVKDGTYTFEMQSPSRILSMQ